MQTVPQSPLEQLRRLVVASEASSRADTLREQIRAASVGLQEAERKVQAAAADHASRSRNIDRGLTLIDAEERALAELMKRVARLGPADRAQSEPLIAESRRDIASRREALESEKKRLASNLADAKVEAKKRLAEYEALMAECDSLSVDPGDAAREVETVAMSLKGFSLEYQIQRLAAEVEDADKPFQFLSREEQKAQLKIWLGYVRSYQEMCRDTGVAREDPMSLTLDGVFGALTRMSKEQMPGFIPEFARGTTPPQGNWEYYIEDAREELARAARAASRRVRTKIQVDEAAYINEIRRIVADDSGDDLSFEADFCEAVHDALLALGADNPSLLEIISPFADVVDRDDRLTSLVRRLPVASTREGGRVPTEVLAWTKGKRGLIVGGQPNADAKATLESAFQFESLEWIASDGAPNGSLVNRCRQGTLDFIIVLIRFVSHSMSEGISVACRGVPTKLVKVHRGYGVSQVSAAFQEAL